MNGTTKRFERALAMAKLWWPCCPNKLVKTSVSNTKTLQGPGGGWNKGSFVMLIGSWPEADGNVHHWLSVNRLLADPSRLILVSSGPGRLFSRHIELWRVGVDCCWATRTHLLSGYTKGSHSTVLEAVTVQSVMVSKSPPACEAQYGRQCENRSK